MSESTANVVLLPAVAPAEPLAAAVDAPETTSASTAGEPASESGAGRFPGRNLWRVLIVLELLALAFAPWIGLRYVIVKHIYNFHVVEPLGPAEKPQLLRCGQLSESGLDAAIRAHGVKTVINLRYGAEDPEIGDGVTEKDVCDRRGVKYVYMPVADVVEEHTVAIPRKDGTGKQMLVPWCVADFLKIMDDPANRPVLLHCRVGKHRTGILTAVWQLEQIPAKASGEDLRRLRAKVINDMVSCGFLLDDRPVYWKERAFIESYQPRGTAGSDLILPYLDRTVEPGQPRPAKTHAPREQRPFDETEPAGSSRGK